METTTHAMTLGRLRGIAVVALAALAASSCGGEEAQPRGDRPPTAVIVNAAILDGRVAVSPRSFGAGPIRLVVTNQTRASQELRLQDAKTGSALRQRTGPINPADTASLKADLPEGRYILAAGRDGDAETVLDVGPPRPNSDDELFQP